MSKEIIGANTYIDIFGRKKVPAKIDTGADSSAIWASSIQVTQDNILKFKLFAPTSPFYNNKIIKRKDFKVVVTRSSHGDEKLFYRTHLPIIIGNHKINALFTLANRANNNFPVLIGKRTLSGKFIVDPSQYIMKPSKIAQTKELNQEMQKNPREFYKKYFKKPDNNQPKID